MTEEEKEKEMENILFLEEAIACKRKLLTRVYNITEPQFMAIIQSSQ